MRQVPGPCSYAISQPAMATAFLSAAIWAAAGARPNIIHIMGDDVGYDNLGHFNGGKTLTVETSHCAASASASASSIASAAA